MSSLDIPSSSSRTTMSKTMIPATAQDTAFVRTVLARMPFAGDMFAPFVEAIENEPLPPINARGGRDAQGWTAVYEATIQPNWVNGAAGLHGAASCWLTDMLTGASLWRLSTDTWSATGPSSAIDMKYYSHAIAGTKIRIITEVDRVGALSTIHCRIQDATTGLRIAHGIHTVSKAKAKDVGRMKARQQVLKTRGDSKL